MNPHHLEIVRTVGEASPGSKMKIVLTRGSNQLTLAVKLASRPDERQLMRNTLHDRPAPVFSAPALDGRTPVTLAGLRRSVVLVDFWATWCGPCIMEMPNVKKVYKELGGPDFEIVGVSLDHDKQRLDAYLKGESIAWPQYFDGGGWGSKVARAYGVSSIPTALLVVRQGRVARVGLRPRARRRRQDADRGKVSACAARLARRTPLV